VKQLQVGGPCISKFGCSESDGYFYLLSPLFCFVAFAMFTANHSFCCANLLYSHKSHTASADSTHKTDPALPALPIIGRFSLHKTAPASTQSAHFPPHLPPRRLVSASASAVLILVVHIHCYLFQFVSPSRCCACHNSLSESANSYSSPNISASCPQNECWTLC
jgi:hypothetical protein